MYTASTCRLKPPEDRQRPGSGSALLAATALLFVSGLVWSGEGRQLTRGTEAAAVPVEPPAAVEPATGSGSSAKEDVTLTVYVGGVEGKLLDNVAAYLEINQPPPKPPEPEKSSAISQLPGSDLIERLPGGGLIERSLEGLIEGARTIASGGQGRRGGLRPIGSFALSVDERRLNWLHARAEEDIRDALKPFGYYHPSIESTLEREGNRWIATYEIEPGPPVRIARVDIRILGEGGSDPAFQALVAETPLSTGKILLQPAYESLKDQLRRVATDRGYFDAQLTRSEIRLDLEANKADIVLHFNSGKRFQFGEITFTEGLLSENLLRRYAKFDPGEPYDSRKLQTLQTNLINSDYFNRVDVSAPSKKAVDRQIPVNVALELRNNRRLDFGVGYGTDTGVRGTAGFEIRRLNMQGHKFSSRLVLSQIKYSLTGVYEIPGSDPTTDAFALSTGVFREDSNVKDASAVVIGGFWRTRRGLWENTLGLDYTFESFRVDERTSSRLLIPNLRLTRLEANDPINIDHGSRLDLLVRGAYEPLLSDVSFFQPVARGKIIQRLTSFGKLIVRGDLGTTLVSDFDSLPTSLRFYAGGDESVRGYKLDTISPRDAEGNLKGGKNLIVASVEYVQHVRGQWSAAVFADTGDAYNFEAPDLKTGVGVGVRWQSPVGPVRIDFAHALDRPPGDEFRIHFAFGPPL
jgi:translocation and assembly module TamA